MQFSEEDKDLVEIINEIGGAALRIHSGNLQPGEARSNKIYAETLVDNYLDQYIQEHNEMPGKSLFSEGIKWYLSTYLGDKPRSLSKPIRDIMRTLILGSYEQYREAYYKPATRPRLVFGF